MHITHLIFVDDITVCNLIGMQDSTTMKLLDFGLEAVYSLSMKMILMVNKVNIQSAEYQHHGEGGDLAWGVD